MSIRSAQQSDARPAHVSTGWCKCLFFGRNGNKTKCHTAAECGCLHTSSMIGCTLIACPASESNRAPQTLQCCCAHTHVLFAAANQPNQNGDTPSSQQVLLKLLIDSQVPQRTNSSGLHDTRSQPFGKQAFDGTALQHATEPLTCTQHVAKHSTAGQIVPIDCWVLLI